VPADPLRPASRPHKIQGLELARLDLARGNVDGASDLAEQALKDPKADQGEATYLIAQIDLIHGNAGDAKEGFEKTLTLTKDPRTLAWSHIYLGRLYDTMATPDRQHAVAEYQAALQVRDSRPDTRQAAEAGLKNPFALPRRDPAPDNQPKQGDDSNFDPTGKAQKDAYKPDPPK
jgi:uncharacterized membrane-anchored protein